jgi:hypothetical protein
MRHEKVLFQWPNAEPEPFLIVIYHSTLVKGAMNASRVCKLRTGVKKSPIFLLFSQAKAEQRP